MKDFSELFRSVAALRVGVIGDVMLDTYMWGKTERISPEAPVPIVALDHKEYRIGGAGNVALNAASLGADVSIFSVTGNDEEAALLEELFTKHGIDTVGLVESDNRITTSKTRIISRNQQMLRLDEEITTDLDHMDEKEILGRITDYIIDSRPHVIIFEDYNKGVLTENLIKEVISLCSKKGVITAVDPKRKNFFSYKGVDIFKPNLKEVKEGLNLLFDEVHESLLQNIHFELHRLIGHRISFITLSDKGVYYHGEGHESLIPSHFRNIADVSGAGDTVIAVAALFYAASRNVHLMAEIANIAGGLVCEEVGTVAIDRIKLMAECEVLLA